MPEEPSVHYWQDSRYNTGALERTSVRKSMLNLWFAAEMLYFEIIVEFLFPGDNNRAAGNTERSHSLGLPQGRLN